MNIANKSSWILVCILGLGIVFLGLDKCGSSSKLDRLKGEHKEASKIAKVERLIKEEIIKGQKEEIESLNLEISELNVEIVEKEEDISGLGNDLTGLEDEFGNLTDKDAKINNLTKQVKVWKERFSLAQGIVDDLGKPIEYYDEHGVKKIKYPEGSITFKLNEKYEAQVVISDSYKTMYETLALNTKKLESIVTAQDWQIKRLRLTSGLKTGIVVGLAGVVLYSLLKD